MLSGYISIETIELLVAHIFSKKQNGKGKNQSPSGLLSGFMRFLSFVSEFDFSSSALVVDPTSILKEEEEEEINEDFEAYGEKYCMFVVAPYDRPASNSIEFDAAGGGGGSGGEKWKPSVTQSVEVVVLRRLQDVARLSLGKLTEWLERECGGGEGESER